MDSDVSVSFGERFKAVLRNLFERVKSYNLKEKIYALLFRTYRFIKTVVSKVFFIALSFISGTIVGVTLGIWLLFNHADNISEFLVVNGIRTKHLANKPNMVELVPMAWGTESGDISEEEAEMIKRSHTAQMTKIEPQPKRKKK